MKINNDLPAIVTPMEPKAVKKDVKQENAKTINQINDTVDISDEGKHKAKNSSNVYNDLEQLQEQLKSSNEQAKSEAETNKIRLKCQEIARRIMKGDVVPKKDHSYLMKNDAGLYMQATSLKMQNDNPKKHKRLSDDEENGDESEAQVGELEQSASSEGTDASPAGDEISVDESADGGGDGENSQ